MVFESIVVDILNKFLGDYVENLDRSQLKIGIWGGDVSLKNLSLKPSALDDLNLPVKTVYGHLGKLVLKIPWKNIYTAPVEVFVENLFLLVHPIQDIVYDEEKEEKIKQDAKQAMISKVEEAKRKEREKDNEKVDDSFVEKLAAQIVKNVQIFIGDIHVRYEDKITKPENPFSVGISLHTLKMYTTNDRCDSYTVPQNESPLFYKIMVMEGLSVYWNTNSCSFTNSYGDNKAMNESFVQGIASKNRKTVGYNYILGPINSDAKLQINSKPELLNFISPKIFLSLTLEQLLMNLRRSQYQDLLILLETFDRMAKAAPFRKYRPHLQVYRGHYDQWWKFAISCTLDDVKRRCSDWSWTHIMSHRQLCRRYQTVYRCKLTEKVSEQVTKELAQLERELDAFNIILIRQKIENEVEREGRLKAEQKAVVKKGGWFGGWFSSGNKTTGDGSDESQTNNIVKQLENAMSDDEKQKLFRAIDYHENLTPTLYPTSFVAIRLEFVLQALKIHIIDDNQLGNQLTDVDGVRGVDDDNYVMTVRFREVFASVSQRPAAQSYAVSLTMVSFETLGLLQQGIVPKIIQSKLSAARNNTEYFLNIFFETNPEDEHYDQRLNIVLRPLKVVYDAQTLIKFLEVFTPNKDITTVKNQIQAAANTKLEEMKEKSSVKLQYAIERSTRLDLKVDLMAPYLILPYGGFYTKNELVLVINLGRITITSKSENALSVNAKRMLKEGSTEDEVFNQMMLKCYDCFKICLGDVQVLALKPGQKWRPSINSPVLRNDAAAVAAAATAATAANVYLHILEPTSVYVDIYKCLIDDDPRLPKIKIDGSLPDVTVKITEKTLLEIVSLIISLPLPAKPAPTEEVTVEQLADDEASTMYDSTASLRQKLASLNRLQFTTLRKHRNVANERDGGVHVEEAAINADYVNLEASLSLKALTVYVQCEQMKEPLIEASATTLQLAFVQRTYSSEISAKLGKISLLQNYNDSVVPAISTPVSSTTEDAEQYLLFCRLLIADKSSPVFKDLYHSTAIAFHADFTKLYAMAHQEAIMTTVEWVTDLQTRIVTLLSASSGAASRGQLAPKADAAKRRKNSASSNVSTLEKKSKKLKTKSTLSAIVEDQLSDINTSGRVRDSTSPEITELKVTATLNEIQICLQTSCRPLATLYIDGLELSASIKRSRTVVDAILHSVSVCDLNPETIYNKVAYISEGKQALTLGIVVLNNHESVEVGENDFDVLVKMQMSSLQCVFMNEFIVDVLEFANNFQTSKKMIAEASAAAVASAKMNVQQVYQSSTRVRLDVFADAPVILVPRNNRSSEIFIVDFGNLSITNALKTLSTYSDCNNHAAAIVDEISVTLKDMQIIRTNHESGASAHVLLKPVNYQLLIKRNLSVPWFTEIADFDIRGEFCPIHVAITTDDYAMVMKTLQENLGAETHKPAKMQTHSSVNEESSENEDVIADADFVRAECHELGEIETVRTMMKFVMIIESVTMDLFTINDNQKDGLARFTLSVLHVSGSMLTNARLSLHALLSNCCVDDTRSSKAANPVKRYMQRKSSSDLSYPIDGDEPATDSDKSSFRSMIDVTFEKDGNDTRVDAHIYSFVLIFNVDHVTKIQEFFLSELTNNETDIHSKSSKKHEVTAPTDTVKVLVTPAKNSSFISMLMCNVTLEKPDVILVENLDDLNTNSIILNNEAKIKIQMSDDNRLAISGVLQDLQLYTCCYNPEIRSQTTSLILHPVTVELNGSSSGNECLHFDVNISEVNVSITAGTIALLTKICSTLIPKIEDESSVSENSSRDYSDIWYQKPIKQGYWFLEMEEGEDALTATSTDVIASAVNVSKEENRVDVIVITVPVVDVTLETGVGKKTTPLLAARSSFQATIKRTSEEMTLESYISLEVGYYNSRLALWEPVIEPIQQSCPTSYITSKYVPWKLRFQCKMLNKTNHDETNSSDESRDVTAASLTSDAAAVTKSSIEEKRPLLALYFNSDERIELTFTKTCMDVVKTLTQSFNDAVCLKSISNLNVWHQVGSSSCYIFVNDFGVDVALSLTDDQPFRLMKENARDSFSDDATGSITVPKSESVRLYKKKTTAATRDGVSALGNENKSVCLLDKLNVTTERDINFLRVTIPCRNKTIALPMSRADKRYFAVKSSNDLSESWGLMSEVDIDEGNVIVTIRSVVRVYNHFGIDVNVYCLKNGKSKAELTEVGVVGPSQHLNVPVAAVYSSKCQLFFAPTGYNVSAEPIVWKDLQKTVSFSKQVCCISKNAENEDPFFMRVLGEMEQVYYENTAAYTVASTAYSIRLRPTLILKNFLPVDVICCLQGVATEYVLRPGQNIDVCTAEPDHSTVVLRLDDYLDKTWSCKRIIKSDAPIFSVWTFTSFDSEKTFSLNLGVWYSNSEDSMIFALYCPYWMVNKTGVSLSYKAVEDGGMILHHPTTFEDPVLFSFKEKSFFSKKKACVRVGDGEWSDKFSIDVAGNSGSILCSYKERLYQLGVYIRLNCNTLTKQVIFSPFFTVANYCPFVIELRESRLRNADWITVDSEACIPFWPNATDDDDKVIELRIADTVEITSSFSYLKISTHTLRLFNSFGGLQADVQVTEGGVFISITAFQPKMATALVINDTESVIEFTEIDLINESADRRSSTGNCKYETWNLKSKNEILLNWSTARMEKPVLIVNKSASFIDLRTDGLGELCTTSASEENAPKKYWISFLCGMQRVLLITVDPHVVKEIEAIADFEQSQQEIEVSLKGVGFSLVNNVCKQELLYLSLSSSGITWEVQKQTGKRFKAVNEQLNRLLEETYTTYRRMLATVDGDDALDLNQEIAPGKDTAITVNFSKACIVKPTLKRLRRVYSNGLWLQIKSSERYKQIHAKVNRLQIDNQIYDCIFPVIFSPVPPSRSVASTAVESGTGEEKPFAELSIVQRIDEYATIQQFKYFKVLVQEFHVKVDIGFINGLVKFLEADHTTDEEEMAQFQTDKKVTKEPLCVHISSVTSQDFYDLLHFTPLKIHISFSLCGENPADGTPQQGLPIVNLLTQSIGVTLTDVNDVVFRLAYFERKHKFYSQLQLISEVKAHYIGQFVKQLYVLVLGLDVLGNPFGLVTGLKQGVEDFFYEPFQGAIQGPSEFAEGVMLGVRSLFGHTVGGAAGAVGRITGAMGKGIAALTLDEDYQKKRRQRLAQQQPSLADGGRGLIMGVVEGVGGVISKPISGAREDGVEGFMKGMGKGMVGLFMRPASGVVDFASGTVDVVRRATTFSEEVRRYRLPRYFRDNGLVIPYSEKDAQGIKLLLDTEKGRFVSTDNYVFHLPMADSNQPDKEILLVSNNRILYLVKSSDIFSDSIKVEWQYTWNEIKEDCITESDYGVCIKVDSNEGRRPASSPVGAFGSLFKRASKGKILIISDKDLRKWLIVQLKKLARSGNATY